MATKSLQDRIGVHDQESFQVFPNIRFIPNGGNLDRAPYAAGERRARIENYRRRFLTLDSF